MVTPFDDDGDLDLDAAAELARWLVEHGNDGLVLAGTTGESPVLTDPRSWCSSAAVREAVSRARDRRDRHQRHRPRGRADRGGRPRPASTASCRSSPYYNRPSQAGLDAHFRAVAAATDLPVVLYDIPMRTGRKVETDTILRLADEVPNIVGAQGRRGRPRRDGPAHRRAPRRASRSTAATTR